MSKIFTIGYSTHTTETFIDLLQKNNITALADVRSYPYSRHTPQFSIDFLKKALKESIIKCDATKIVSYINSFNRDDSYTNEIERGFEFAYANNIAINHKEILLDKKTTAEVKKLAMIYMNDNEK